MDNWQRAGFGLYVHWPFCEAKCPYCDFNSHVVASVDQARWTAALTQEIQRLGRETPGRTLSSIFFGGGTPSLMQADTVASVIQAAQQTWSFANDIEITLEANPTSAEAERFEGYRMAGINRLSIGVQALNDSDLTKLGRLHSAEEALMTLELARHTFERVSFDIIYARQDQTLSSWKQELRQVLAFNPDHLSLYQLTIEPGTAFGRRHALGRLRGLPDDELSADMFDLTQEVCGDAGLPAYEISNHARPGAASLHNLIYWRSGDWVGVGPGAHGRYETPDGRVATEAKSAPGAWLAAVEQGVKTSTAKHLAEDDIASDALMMGFRLAEGVPSDNPAWRIFLEKRNKINDLLDQQLLARQGDRIVATAKGRSVLNALVGEILN